VKRHLTFVCAALILSVMAFSETKTVFTHAELAMPPSMEKVTAVPLYWFTTNNVAGYFMDKTTAFHYYTADADLAAALKQQPTWKYQGIIGYVFPKQVPGTVPLYRLEKIEFNNSNHLYTIDHKEAVNAFQNLDWAWDPIVGYVSPKKVTGTKELYRLYYPPYKDEYGDIHFYTTDGVLKDSYLLKGFVFIHIEAYIWSQPTTLSTNAADNSNSSDSKGGPVTKPRPGPMSPTDQLFSLGCAQDAAKKQVTCPSVRGWETCNYYKNKGELKVSSCTTTADQAAFAKIETDLVGLGCKRFLGRAGEYYCKDSKGVQACEGYLKKKDGLITRCYPLNYRPT
jgi:hypothetical protein